MQELIYEGRREPFAKLRDLQNDIRDKWHDVDDQTMINAILQCKRHLAAVAKQNGGPILHIICRSGGLRTTSDDMNDKLLAIIVL